MSSAKYTQKERLPSGAYTFSWLKDYRKHRNGTSWSSINWSYSRWSSLIQGHCLVRRLWSKKELAVIAGVVVDDSCFLWLDAEDDITGCHLLHAVLTSFRFYMALTLNVNLLSGRSFRLTTPSTSTVKDLRTQVQQEIGLLHLSCC